MIKIINFCLVGLVISACSADIPSQLDLEDSDCKSIVIKERQCGKWMPYKYVSKLSTQSIQIPTLTHADYLGYSVRMNEFPIEDTRNIGYRVINTDALFKKYKRYFSSLQSKSSESSYFAYSSFDDYEEKSTITKKVNGGLDLKFFCFSLGAKHEYTKSFSSDMISNSHSAFGELNIVVRDSIYRMQYNNIIKKRIILDYLDGIFQEELHLTHPYEFYRNYGPFVIRDFTTGGKASAMYAGIHKYSSDKDTKTTDMNNEIESSFSFKKSDSLNSGNLLLGRGNSTMSSYVSQFNGAKMSIRAIGGESSYGAFSIPQNIDSTNIDLSGWLSSMSNPASQSLCEFNSNGLIPITDFILEKNLIYDINQYMKGVEPQNVDIIEPHIYIDTASWDSCFSVLVAYIVNRYGDAIRLDIDTFNDYDDDVIEKLSKWGGDIGKNFNLKVIYHTPIIDSYYGPYPLTRSIDKLSIIARDIKLAKKIEYNNMIYIIDEDNCAGFSIPNIPEYIEEYGWTEIINKLSNSDLTYWDLWGDSFEIYAL